MPSAKLTNSNGNPAENKRPKPSEVATLSQNVLEICQNPVKKVDPLEPIVLKILRPFPSPFSRRFCRIFALIVASAGLAIFGSSCAVLVGNVNPVDQKSETYGIMDLQKSNPDWVKLDPSLKGTDGGGKPHGVESTEIPDVAYQSKKTAAIISLDSACRNDPENPDEDLKALTNLLLLGISDVSLRQEEPLVLMGNAPALQTTIEGRLSGDLQGKRMAIRTIVMKRKHCDYDFVYMARPEKFNLEEPDFAQFVASLRVK
jgi:hypothetical protein